jgi:hypothetical protein
MLHAYEIRPRKDHRGVDMISDALPFGRLWYGEPDAVSNAVETFSPEKVLILVLNMKAKHYESFRTDVNPILGMSLPAGTTLAAAGFGQVCGFIEFGTDLEAECFAASSPAL